MYSSITPYNIKSLEVVRVVSINGDTGQCKCVLRSTNEAIEAGCGGLSKGCRL